MPIPAELVLDELKMLLAMPPEVYVYFDHPVVLTGPGGDVRDRAVGLWNYVLDIHVFTMSDRYAPKIYACYGPLSAGHWYSFRYGDLGHEYQRVARAVMEQVAFLREIDGTIKSTRHDTA